MFIFSKEFSDEALSVMWLEEIVFETDTIWIRLQQKQERQSFPFAPCLIRLQLPPHKSQMTIVKQSSREQTSQELGNCPI